MMKRVMLLCMVVLLMTGCWQVSEGERAGVVTKFTHKGLFWLSWEGELHFAGANGTIVADSWEFALDNSRIRGEDLEKLIQTLNEAQRSGKRVRINYVEEMITAPWRSGSAYLVQSVELLEK